MQLYYILEMPRKYRRKRGYRRGRRVFRNKPVPLGGKFGGTRAAHVPLVNRVAGTFKGTMRGFVPNTKVCKLRYSTEVKLDAQQTGMGAFIFRANSLYDPEAGAIGHSCYMFDQIMLFYKKYRVIGSKIKAWSIYPVGSTANSQYATIIRSSTGTTYLAFANTAHLLESNLRGNVKMVGTSVNDSVLAPGGQKTILTHTYSQRKFFPGILDKELEGEYNSNPSQQCYWELITAPLGNVDPAPVSFRIEIDMTAIFSEPILMSESGVDELGNGIGGTGGSGYGNAWGSTGLQGPFAAGDGGENGSTGPRSMN